MLKAIFNWFTGRPLPGTEAPPVKEEAVPYKIETPPVVVQAREPEPVTETAKSAPAPKIKKPVAKKSTGKTADKPAAPKKPRKSKS